MLLNVENLTKTFAGSEGPVTVLRGVDLALGAGETLALTGESGSGKSTLLHLIGGLDDADGGSIRLDGLEVTALDDASSVASPPPHRRISARAPGRTRTASADRRSTTISRSRGWPMDRSGLPAVTGRSLALVTESTTPSAGAAISTQQVPPSPSLPGPISAARARSSAPMETWCCARAAASAASRTFRTWPASSSWVSENTPRFASVSDRSY
ncbi:MAG: ATP-binding cassette domain-containing protein [Rhodobacteraceae bacterium]|nr:ATP-binding cassette domain-containing protein [Paracoccaceae bacterium]